MFLSIIIPYYNCGPYIYSCLKSIDEALSELGHTSIEVIIVDDFNDQKQVAMLESSIYVLHNNNDFKIIRPNHNLGLSDARNFGVQNSNGEYIFFLDADDYVNKNNLAEIVNTLKAVSVDAIYFNSHTFKSEYDWREMNKFSFQPRCVVEVDDTVVSQYLQDCTFYAWRFIIKKEIAQKAQFHSRLYMEDIATTPLLLSLAKTIWYEPISVVNYRIRPNSIMTTWNPKKFTDMVLASTITNTDISNKYKNSTQISEQLKLLGYRFFYWSIADARKGNKSKVTHTYYQEIKSLYVKNFGEFKVISDYHNLRKVFDISESLKWVLLYYSYTIYNTIITPYGNLKYKALRKRIYTKGQVIIKISFYAVILFFIALNIYNLF